MYLLQMPDFLALGQDILCASAT